MPTDFALILIRDRKKRRFLWIQTFCFFSFLSAKNFAFRSRFTGMLKNKTFINKLIFWSKTLFCNFFLALNKYRSNIKCLEGSRVGRDPKNNLLLIYLPKNHRKITYNHCYLNKQITMYIIMNIFYSFFNI